MAQIVTFGTLAAKGVIRDVGRVHGPAVQPSATRWRRWCPAELNMTLDLALEKNPELKAFYEYG